MYTHNVIMLVWVPVYVCCVCVSTAWYYVGSVSPCEDTEQMTRVASSRCHVELACLEDLQMSETSCTPMEADGPGTATGPAAGDDPVQMQLQMHDDTNEDGGAIVRAEADTFMESDPRVLANLVSSEQISMPTCDYFTHVQDDLQPFMRKVVTTWMFEVFYIHYTNLFAHVRFMLISFLLCENE